MTFDIHGFAPTDSGSAPAGLLVLRFAEPADATQLGELARQLTEAGVLDTERTSFSGGSLAALPWRVPTSEEADSQRSALNQLHGVSEAWAFAQSAEADLSDWFAPKWRRTPPVATSAFADTRLPERVSWEGFGISMIFDRQLDEGDREVVRALAQLWLTAYSDQEIDGPLGSKCYQRAVVAPHGASGVIVGLEGLANPGSDSDAVGHLLWLAEQVGRVLPLSGVTFMTLLPQAGESGETIAPAKVLERATREWSTTDLIEPLDISDVPELFSDAAAAATDEVETITGDAIGDDDDDSWSAETQSLPGADQKLAQALADREERREAELDDIAAEQPEPDDPWAAETAHLVSADEKIAEALAGRKDNFDDDDESWSAETNYVPRGGQVVDEAHQAQTNGLSTQVEITPAPEVDPSDATALDAGQTLDGELEPVSGGGAGNAEAIGRALEEGDLAAAIAAYDASDNKASDASILLDVVEELDASDWDDLGPIIELGTRIIASEPESSNAHLQMISALCRLGRGDEAIALGLGALDKPEVLWETFERLCVFRRLDEAEPLLAGLAESGHEGVGNHYYNLGCKLHATQPAVAIALYRGAVACGSPRPQADINAGLALMSLGRFDEAAAITKAALDTCGDEPNLWANLIDVQTRTDSPELDASLERAASVFEQFEADDEADAPAASGRGWGALVADMTDALLLRDRAAEAITLIENTSGEAPLTPRVVFAKARALATSGDFDSARALLDHVSTDDATATAYYRARANVMYLAGDLSAAIGAACAAVMTDADALTMMRRDPVGAAIASLEVGSDGSPPRAPSVPEDAVWVASDLEWEHGARDADGEKHGPYRYYRADGTLCNECTLEHGKPHGEFLRFHESGEVSQKGAFEDGELHGTRVWLASPITTSEQMHNEQISTLIRRSEMDYVKGRVVAVRHFNGEGILCAPNGEPYPDRPGDVSADAFFRSEDEEWVAGEVDNEGQRRGVWRRWNNEGVLLEESEFAAGERDGSFKAYFPDGSLSAEGQYRQGEKTGTFVYQRRGDDEHEDFPIAASAIGVAEESHETSVPSVRLYDRSGREVTIDATPLEEWTTVHPALESWFNELWQVPWPELDDASSNAHRVPHLLLGLLATDEDISEFVYRALYWHLYHQGSVYSGTAAAMPFLVRLTQAPNVPFLSRLCDFIRHAGCWPSEALEEAAETGEHAVISTNEALMKRIDAFIGLLGHDDPKVRAAAGAVLSGAHTRADEMSSQLSGALAAEESEMVRASHMFSLAQFGTPEALFVVEAQLSSGSPLVDGCAAMAMVMARGEEAGERAAERLVSALVNYTDEMGEAYSESPWSDDHLVTEIAQALHYACEGNSALERLTAVFGDVNSADGVAVVAASLMIASAAGDGLSDEVRATLRSIADTATLWSLGDALPELLESYELPTSPEELRALADQ